MSLADDPELRRLFETESAEQLEQLADGALTLERAAVDPEVIARLFRAAHTLKSSAALMGFAAAGELAHGLEDVLGELRSGARPATPEVTDTILRVVDALRLLCEAGPEPEPPAPRGAHPLAGPGWAALAAVPSLSPAGAAERLEALPPTGAAERLEALPPPGAAERLEALPPAGARDAAASPEDAGSAPGGRRVVVSYEDAVFRKLFADEVGPELDRLLEVALELEARGPEPALVAALFRGAHSLKGSAAVVGFDGVSRLAHRLEDQLSDLRAGTRQATPAFVDALLVTLDAIRTATPLLAAGDEAADALAAGAAALAAGAADEPAAAIAGETASADPRSAKADGRAPAPVAPRFEPAARAPDALIPVGLDRLDLLVRLAGEAIAAQLRLAHLLGDRVGAGGDAQAAAQELRRVLGSIQEQALQTRMTTLQGVASTLRRAARDVARVSGKEVDYRLEGDRVQLDRAVLDGLRDPLLHLVRNAVDHGLESPDLREARGKPRRGSVRVTAGRRGSEVLIAVSDDGRGLDLDALRARAATPDLDDVQAADLIFRAGLSTAGTVTDISGRGVGLDAVRTGVEALRGRVEVASEPGRGCTFTVTVPLTLAVLPCLQLRAGRARYHVPVHAAATLADDPPDAEVGLEGGSALWVGGDAVPISPLAAVLGHPGPAPTGPALVLDGPGGTRHAFRVDALLGQRDVTVKELGGVVPRSALVTGASIEPDGAVVLVLDPAALVDRARRRTGARRPVASLPAEAPAALRSVLVVDDAMTVRELQRSILERAGYSVRVAVDGEQALARLAEARPDMVVTDLEMPNLDGFGLVRRIRETPALASLPVLMVTSRASEADRRAGLEAGADGYLVKQDFDEPGLLQAVGRLLGE